MSRPAFFGLNKDKTEGNRQQTRSVLQTLLTSHDPTPDHSARNHIWSIAAGRHPRRRWGGAWDLLYFSVGSSLFS